jgi:hypothetical protein
MAYQSFLTMCIFTTSHAALAITLHDPILRHMAAFARAGLDSGLYFMDQLRREAKAVADVDLTTGGSYTIRSTVNPALQRAVETALQDGLVRYEMNYGRARFQGPETNLAKTVQRLEASASKSGATTPAWQRALTHANLMLYDVHWTPAIVTEIGGRKGGGLRVGLKDGRTVPLSVRVGRAESALKLYDIVYVKMIDGSNKTPVRAELRVPPSVLDAAPVQMHSADRVAFYQLKTILQGVVARGTAAAAADLSATWAGRPAPRKTRMTPGSPASPMTSPSWCGSITTTRAERAAPSEAAAPAVAWRCRSGSRS